MTNLPIDAYDALLAAHTPPGLLLDSAGQILHAFGPASELLTVRPGRVGTGLLDLLPVDIATAIDGLENGQTTEVSGWRITAESLGRYRFIRTQRTASIDQTIRAVFDAVPVPVVGLSADEVYLYANPAYYRAFRREPAMVIGERLINSVGPEGYQQVAGAIQRALKGDITRYEARFTIPGGTHPMRFKALCAPHIEPSGIVRAVYVLLTDFDQHEAISAQSAQLEGSIVRAQHDDSLAVLAGGVAHDFNNLLTTMMANAGLLERLLGPTDPRVRQARQITEIGHQAAELCRQLLDYAGRGALVRRQTELSRLVEDMHRLLRASLPSTITARLEIGEGLPMIEVDRARLRQVVLNLLTNAADALGDTPGTITIRTQGQMLDRDALRTIGAENLPAGHYALLQVEDSGPGIDPTLRSRIFEPFFTTKEQGRGLGLAAIAGIVRSHGGVIAVDSTLGEGATFTVYLPSAKLALQGLPQLDRPATILIADDEVAVREATQRILQAAGCTCLTASDGLEALEVLERADVQLVVMDLTMPRMDGLTALQTLRATRPDLPVLLVTAYPDDPRLGSLATDPATQLVPKPWQPALLVERVRSLVSDP